MLMSQRCFFDKFFKKWKYYYGRIGNIKCKMFLLNYFIKVNLEKMMQFDKISSAKRGKINAFKNCGFEF